MGRCDEYYDDGREEDDYLIDDTLSSYLSLTIMLMERLRVERGVEGRDDETKTKTKFWTTIIHVSKRCLAPYFKPLSKCRERAVRVS